jgi:hypothetical protein
LYIDQLNQDYDNPILRKELIAISQRKERDRAKEIILKQIAVAKRMIKIMSFPFYFKLPAQRTYRTIACGNYIGSYVFHSFWT